MGYHHLAFASRDMAATHRFYSEVLGLRAGEGGRRAHRPARRLGQAPLLRHRRRRRGRAGRALIAFWELHDERMAGNDTAISTGLGFEAWVNHVAFAAADLDDIARRRDQWLDAGIDVMEIDHGFCVSIYTMDPNGILVEFCTDTAPYTAGRPRRARSPCSATTTRSSSTRRSRRSTRPPTAARRRRPPACRPERCPTCGGRLTGAPSSATGPTRPTIPASRSAASR